MSFYSGTISGGVVLSGSAQNPLTISSYTYVTNTTSRYSGDGIYGTNAAVWGVTNLGRINAPETGAAGVFLAAGGTVTNGAATTTSALIAGESLGVALFGAVAVGNFGTIQGTGSNGIGILSRGNGAGAISNAQSGMISGGEFGVVVESGSNTVNNLGTIAGASSGGIYLAGASAGMVVNGAGDATGALISGGLAGVRMNSAAETVVNYGDVAATAINGTGIDLTSGRVTNFGMIAAPSATAVYVRYGTFTNFGMVEGRVTGVELALGTGAAGSGRVTVSGTVIGATGIDVAPGVSAGQTVAVGGTVMGTSGTAVALAGGTDRLIVDHAAVFGGTVNGGGGGSVLEIAVSETASDTSAAIGGQGAAFFNLNNVTDFSVLQIDPGGGANASGPPLSFGTLINQGQIDLEPGNSLTFAAVASAPNTGTINVEGTGLLNFTGAVAAQTIAFEGAAGLVKIAQPTEFFGTVTGFAAGNTIDLPGGIASNPVYSGGVLSLSYLGATVALDVTTAYASPQFQLASDSFGGTDITVAQGASSPPPALSAAQINTVYSNVLGRPASAAEQSAWVAAETSSSLSAAQVIADIVNSPEAVDYSWAIVRLYQASLGRIPDQAGFIANTNAIDAQAGGAISFLQVAADFAVEPEFVNLYGAAFTGTTFTQTTLAATLLAALYENVLGRAGSQAEVQAWLATGDTAAEILVGFVNSQEFQNDVNGKAAALLTADANDQIATPPTTALTGSGSLLALTAAASTTGDGTQTAASLALLSQYAASGFAMAPGQGQGTLVTQTAQTDPTAPNLLTLPQH
jgi:hypothetical protein